MALKEKEKQKWEEALVNLNLMEANDEVEDAVMGNSRSMMSWEQGDFVFTKERFIFSCRSLIPTCNFSIKYSDIRSISKCLANGFFPMGIKIEAFNPEKNKVETYKCCVSKRDKWIGLLSEKSGVSCS